MVCWFCCLGFVGVSWAQVDSKESDTPTQSSSRNIRYAAPASKPARPTPAALKGRVVGLQGKAISKAVIKLTRNNWPEDSFTGASGNDGRFQLKARNGGLYWLSIKKKGFATGRVLLWLQSGKQVDVEAALKVATKPASKPSSQPTSRPAAYYKKSHPRLVVSSWKVKPAFAAHLSPVVVLARTGQAEWRKALKRHKRSGAKGPFHYSWQPTYALIEKQAKASKLPLVQYAWWLLKCSLGASGGPGEMQKYEAWRHNFMKDLHKKISPTSVLWSMSSRMTLNAIGMMGSNSQSYNKKVRELHSDPSVGYILRVVKLMRMGFRWRGIRRSMLQSKQAADTQKGKFKKQSLAKVKEFKGLLKQAKRETLELYHEMKAIVSKYPSKRLTRWLKRSKWHTHVAFPVGSKIPPFQVKLWGSSRPTFTQKDLLGHHTLIMFWATWCGPCVAKMPLLHKMYAHYKTTKKFQILAVSYDSNAAILKDYRAKKWKMPWFNHLAQKGSRSNIGELFETVILPTLFLVGPDGKVMARGMDLRSQTFRPVMTRLLGELPPPKKK